MSLRSGGFGAAWAGGALVLAACSGAPTDGLLGGGPPQPVETQEDASSKGHHDASDQGGGHDEASADDPEASDMSQGGDDSGGGSGDDVGDELDAADGAPPGAEPVSPCPSCGFGSTCCAKATSLQFGQCYGVLCGALCCN